MQKPHAILLHSRIIRIGGAIVAAVIGMSILSGCVFSMAVKLDPPETPAATPAPSGATQLADGRDGFRITEIARMTAQARQEFDRSVALLNEEKYQEAIAILEAIVAQSPNVTAPYINLGIAYQRIDQPEKAEEHFKAALEIAPDHPVICNQYGLLARRGGRFDEARAFYEQALIDFPNYYPVHRNLGILCDLYLNDLACALEHYEIYSRAMPEDSQVKMWIADLRARMGS